MRRPVFFVTGTDTGVGKTAVAVSLARRLCEQGIAVAALKPVCSGGREDARKLRRAAGNTLLLDEVNPWHFRAAVAPLLAARRERRKLRLAQVLKHIRSVAHRYDVVIVEGAGGLLSPLGEGFDSRDLMLALKALPVIVAPNRLGSVNQVLLALEALPRPFRNRAQIVLVNPARASLASRTNPALLGEFVPQKAVRVIPWVRS